MYNTGTPTTNNNEQNRSASTATELITCMGKEANGATSSLKSHNCHMRKDIFYKDDKGCREASHPKAKNSLTMPTNNWAENYL